MSLVPPLEINLLVFLLENQNIYWLFAFFCRSTIIPQSLILSAAQRKFLSLTSLTLESEQRFVMHAMSPLNLQNLILF